MNRKPISRERLALIVKEATDALSPRLLLDFLSVSVMPYAIAVRFSAEADGLHSFWILARTATKLLFFDDVEEYFSTGYLDDDGILRTWVNIEPQDRLDGALADVMA